MMPFRCTLGQTESHYGKADFLGLILTLVPHSAGLIRRRINGDFNFDATPGAENIYPLVRVKVDRIAKTKQKKSPTPRMLAWGMEIRELEN